MMQEFPSLFLGPSPMHLPITSRQPGSPQAASQRPAAQPKAEGQPAWASPGGTRLQLDRCPAAQHSTAHEVIKVPEGAVLRGCKKTRRKLREHLRLRAEIHSQLRVIASLLVLRIFLTCLVGYPTPGFPSAPQPPAVQPPGSTQAFSAAFGVWDPATGQLKADQLRRWKLTKGEHLAAASSAGTSLEANLKHITIILATWDAVWEVYLDPKWARQRLRLYGAQDRALEQFFNKLEEEMAELSMKRHGCAKQLVVFFGAATIGTGGGWGADAVLRACRKVVCRPRGKDQDGGRVVLVDEHRTSRVSSAVNGQQPCEVELDKLSATRPADWKPPAGQVEPRLLRPAWSQERGQPVRGMMWCPVVAPRKPPQAPRSSQAATPAAASEPGPSTPLPAKRSKRTKAEPAAEPTKAQGKAAKAKPAPQPGSAEHAAHWGEEVAPTELCWWPEQGALPAKGKEYPGLGYKRVRDKPPKAQEQQQQPAEAQ
ncbi:hypothetical protein QJQ45_006771 [Haematococcus lacustris]|nr:hypothetical protein QJQ45_006771 [Haematococcus lacustris]